jgi:acyl carrier protein
MNDDVFGELAKVIGEIMSVDPATLTHTTSAEDVDNWDSLNHFRLITAVEQHFAIRLSMNEIMALENVGDLARIVGSKVGPR